MHPISKWQGFIDIRFSLCVADVHVLVPGCIWLVGSCSLHVSAFQVAGACSGNIRLLNLRF